MFNKTMVRGLFAAAMRILPVLALGLSLCLSGRARADEIVAWGYNADGEVSAAPTGNDFTAIAAGYGYAGYALRADGSIAAWGWNSAEQVSGALRAPVSRRSQGVGRMATR